MENYSRFFRRLHFLSIKRKLIEIVLSTNFYLRLFRGKIILMYLMTGYVGLEKGR
jgi:hypothetical protein